MANMTRDHDTIRRWAEERDGEPVSIKGTEDGELAGVLRIDFRGYGDEDGDFHRISWDEFFDKFDQKGLTFLYQEETAGGERSTFYKLVDEDTLEEEDVA